MHRHVLHLLSLGISYLTIDSLRRATRYLQQTIEKEAEGPITRALLHLVQRVAARSRQGDVPGASTVT